MGCCKIWERASRISDNQSVAAWVHAIDECLPLLVPKQIEGDNCCSSAVLEKCLCAMTSIESNFCNAARLRCLLRQKRRLCRKLAAVPLSDVAAKRPEVVAQAYMRFGGLKVQEGGCAKQQHGWRHRSVDR